MSLKLIIAGSRIFTDYEFLRDRMDELGLQITEIVSGAADGVDTLAIRYARERNIPCKQFPVTPAEWAASDDAGFRRNTRMAEYADYLVAFTLGTPGTAHMIREMKRLGKPYIVIDCKKKGGKTLRDF